MMKKTKNLDDPYLEGHDHPHCLITTFSLYPISLLHLLWHCPLSWVRASAVGASPTPASPESDYAFANRSAPPLTIPCFRASVGALWVARSLISILLSPVFKFRHAAGLRTKNAANAIVRNNTACWPPFPRRDKVRLTLTWYGISLGT